MISKNMSDCIGCGNQITSTNPNNGKGAGEGALHFVCKNEAERRDRENLCGICGMSLVDSEFVRCDNCEKKPDDYQLKDYYNAL